MPGSKEFQKGYDAGYDKALKEFEEICEYTIENRHWFKKMMMYILQL